MQNLKEENTSIEMPKEASSTPGGPVRPMTKYSKGVVETP